MGWVESLYDVWGGVGSLYDVWGGVGRLCDAWGGVGSMCDVWGGVGSLYDVCKSTPTRFVKAHQPAIPAIFYSRFVLLLQIYILYVNNESIHL